MASRFTEQSDSEPPCRVEGVPLTSLRTGAHATVHRRLLGEQECELLAAMGLSDRCLLRVCRAGEPCIVQIAATRLGLSRAMARRVMVVPETVPVAGRAPRPRR